MAGNFSDCLFCEHNPNRLEEIEKRGDGIGLGLGWSKLREGCAAYPDGIPEAVVNSGHTYPKPDDHGIQFKGVNPFNSAHFENEDAENKCYQAWVEYFDQRDLADEDYLKKYGHKKTTGTLLVD